MQQMQYMQPMQAMPMMTPMTGMQQMMPVPMQYQQPVHYANYVSPLAPRQQQHPPSSSSSAPPPPARSNTPGRRPGPNRGRSAGPETRCFQCNETGHYARDCPRKGSEQQQQQQRSQSQGRGQGGQASSRTTTTHGGNVHVNMQQPATYDMYDMHPSAHMQYNQG
jgi:hypothetical protein